MKKITLKEITEKIAKLEALEVVLKDTIIADDISEILRKYEVLLKNAEDADLEPSETLLYPESTEDVASFADMITNHISILANTVTYKGCDIVKGHRFGTYLIKNGKISTVFSPSTPQAVKDFFAKLKEKGFIDNAGNVLKDIECSASMAVSIISGSNKNGRPILEKLWK